MIPRIIMGVLSVIDTFFIYKITIRRYNHIAGLSASLFFAVMPLTWMIRRVFLDNIETTFLLSSVLLCVYAKDQKGTTSIFIFISGILLGLSIFTKVPSFTFIPLVGLCVYLFGNKNIKNLLLWFVPVIAIPFLWPISAAFRGHFSIWLNNIISQTSGRERSILDAIMVVFRSDPLLSILSLIAIVFAIIKRDYFILLWILPYTILLTLINQMTFSYWSPIIPVFCIAIGVFISEMCLKIKKINMRKLAQISVIGSIGLFGLVSTSLLINTNVSYYQIQAASFVMKYINEDMKIPSNNVTVISGSSYSWLFKHVYGLENVFYNFYDPRPLITNKVILMADNYYKNSVRNLKGNEEAQRLEQLYNSTKSIAKFGNNTEFDYDKYPNYSLRYANRGGGSVDIRIN